MNMFNFLDNLIKGTVQFLLDLLYSIGTLIAHPLTGAPRLYRDDQDRSKIQISSLTFLVLALMIGGAVDAGYDGPDNPQAADNTLGKITGLLTTGASPDGFGPILAGVVVSVILIALMLRGIARVANLEGRRRDRFLAVMEYQVGLFLLLLAFLTLWDMSLPSDYDGTQASNMDIFLYVYLVLPIAIFSLGVQFWIALTRSPRLHRLRRRLPRFRRRWTRRQRAGEAPPERRGGAAALALFTLVAAAAMVAAIPPALLGWLGKQGGWEVSSWMLDLNKAKEAAEAARKSAPVAEAVEAEPDPLDVIEANEQVMDAEAAVEAAKADLDADGGAEE